MTGSHSETSPKKNNIIHPLKSPIKSPNSRLKDEEKPMKIKIN